MGGTDWAGFGQGVFRAQFPVAGLAQSGDVVDVDSEKQHGLIMEKHGQIARKAG